MRVTKTSGECMSHIQSMTQWYYMMAGRHLKPNQPQTELPKLKLLTFLWFHGLPISDVPETEPAMIWGFSIAQVKMFRPTLG